MKRTVTLMELQDVFGERIKALTENNIPEEERENEYERTRIIIDLGKNMINNADIVMRHEALMAKCQKLNDSKMPDLIGE